MYSSRGPTPSVASLKRSFYLLDLFRAPTIDGHWQFNRVEP